jgi:hypothetical protein
MIKFKEFVDAKELPVSDVQSDQTEILKRIVHNHGSRFKALLKSLIRNGDVGDDPDLLKDLKELCQSMTAGSYDQLPIQQKKNYEKDVVTRPSADGGSAPTPPGEGGGEN